MDDWDRAIRNLKWVLVCLVIVMIMNVGVIILKIVL